MNHNGNLITVLIINDMKRLFYIFALLTLLPSAVRAQKIEWNLDNYGFFDNSEGEDNYRKDQTMAGVRISPEVGVSWDKGRHAIYAGYSGIAEFGADKSFSHHKAKLYYQYRNKRLRFLFGAFSREQLMGDYPSYLICDSIYYYRPVMQGWAFQYDGQHGFFEAFVDWTQKQSETEREQFMAGLSTSFNFHHLRLGTEGYYYHYALTAHALDTDHIHDYLIANPFIGLTYSNVAFLDSIGIAVGSIVSLDRERGPGASFYTRAGFVGELYGRWNRLTMYETVYAGDHQQHFKQNGWNKYYWGDSYTQAKFWSRTDVFYQFIRNRYVDAYAGLVVNATQRGVNCHQVITVRANIGTYPRQRKWRK